MQQTKQTKLQQVKAYLEANPNATPKQTAEALSMKLEHVYNLRCKLNPNKKSTGKPKAKKVAAVQSQGAEIALLRKQIEQQQDEIIKLNTWVLSSSKRLEAKDAELNDVKVAFMDATAIIRYLEKKIVDLLEANDDL